MHIAKTLSIAVTVICVWSNSNAVAKDANLFSTGTIEVLETFRECDFCPDMVVLPTRNFEMGSTPDQAKDAYKRFALAINRDTSEGFTQEVPKHRVTIDLHIAIGRTEVTREEWAACVDEGGCLQGRKELPDDRIRFRLQSGPHQWHPKSPIRGVTYSEMLEYVAWLNSKVGSNVYRLPTEAEWEYAARAGTATNYAQGDVLAREQANYFVFLRETDSEGFSRIHDGGNNEKMPVPVDHLDADNAWGLRHMSGNVSEMTQSCWSKHHVGLSTSSEHLRASRSPLTCERVTKGGSYTLDVELARVAHRSKSREDYWSTSLGFRVVRDLRN